MMLRTTIKRYKSALFIGVCSAGLTISMAASAFQQVASQPVPQPPAVAPLSADDVSILFPPPVAAGDLNNRISMDSMQNAAQANVWAAFNEFVGKVTSPASQVAGTQDQITFPPALQQRANWFIAGIRIDSGAPGLSHDIIGQFGQSPQIRLIVQPVTIANGLPQVHDVAVHLIFNFTSGGQPASDAGCQPMPSPDTVTFSQIVSEITDIRNRLASGQIGGKSVPTANLPLGVHPGLADPMTASALQQEIKAFLLRHISADRLVAMAIVSVPDPAPKPWIFMSMIVQPVVTPVPSPTLSGLQFAEELRAAGDVGPNKPRVAPVPAPNNLAINITCHSNLAPPLASTKGVSTSDVFAAAQPTPEVAQVILDTVANPNVSHFFNTDCVSCHTETTRTRKISPALPISNIDPAALAAGDWDVRNFGWTPTEGSPSKPSITRRAANETDEVVKSINALLASPGGH